MRLEVISPEFLFLFVFVPLLAFAHFIFLKYNFRKGMKFSNFRALRRITGKSLLTKNLSLLIMRMIVIIFVILAAAGLFIIYEGPVQDSDFVIAIDSSASMSATDFKPSRLGASKNIAKEFISSVGNKARIGIVGFSGYSQVYATLSDDNVLTRDAVNVIGVDSSGTDIPSAIITSTNVLLASESGRQMLLITDGEMTTSLFEDRSIERAIDYAQFHGVKVNTIGVGTANATPLGYLPRIEGLLAQYNENNLQLIANQTGGRYHYAQNEADLEFAFGSILDQVSIGEKRLSLSGWLLAIAIILIFIEWILANTHYRILP